MSVLPHRGFNTAGALTVVALILPSVLSAQQTDPTRYGELHFRHIRPLGNRVSSVAGASQVTGLPTGLKRSCPEFYTVA